ncbi:MAG: nucleotide sugar dehydrogenase, partial [Clostridia bacterium]|nr:nucleotide sugar dehydrogenase [Clostridia bacterium]
PWFLVGDYPDLALLIKQAREINSGMPSFVFDRITEIMKEKGITDYKRVGLYGITYKEDVDDIRESPTLQLIDVMNSRAGVCPALYDPMVAKKLNDNQYMDFGEFLANIDMVVIMVGHSHLKEHLDDIKNLPILDTRHVCFLDGVYRL